MSVHASASQRATHSFGMLRQTELQYMVLADVPALSRLMYMTLVLRAGPSRVVPDGIASLSKWSGLGDRTVRACLADLMRRGIIRRRRKPKRKGDGRGSFSSSTELVPYDEWPREPLMRYIAATVAYVNVFYPTKSTPDVRALPTTNMQDMPDGPTTNRHRTNDQQAQNERPTGTATRNNPEPYLELYPERDAPCEDDEEDARADQVVEDLTARWRTVRHEQGLTRFGDAVACRWLLDAARALQRDGYEVAEIRLAIEEHINEPFADPRELRRWTEVIREERLSRERDAKRAEAKRLREAEHDALVERDRAARIAAGVPLPKLSIRRN